MKYSITKILNIGAVIYDNWAEHNLSKINKRLIELANLNGNEKVLDIGCGPGNLDLMITENFGKDCVYGIDIAPKMIRMAKKKAKERSYNIDYRIGSSTMLPYKNNEFNIVYTCLFYHHLNYKEKDKTLKEIHRVLKDNGKYVCLEFGEFPKDGFHKFFLKLFTEDSGIMHGLYPSKSVQETRFCVDKKIKGPCFLKHHCTTYRVLIKK
jgi:ubiquinone/menaquinone biosynthesis C-methylase UbiE